MTTSHGLLVTALRAGVVALHEKYVPKDIHVPKADETIVAEYERQEEYLSANLEVLKGRLEHDVRGHRDETDSIIASNLALIEEIKSLRSRIARIKASRQDAVVAASSPLASITRSGGLASARGVSTVDPRVDEALRRARAFFAEQVGQLERAIAAANPASRVRAGAM